MTSIRRASCLVRQWSSGAGLAAAAAAVIGMGTVHADDLSTDIGLLNSAETNVTDAFNVWTQAYGEAPPSSDTLTQLITQTEAIQTPLLSSDNSLLSGLGESLFNGPDQQLAQASDAFLSAADAYAADPSTTTGLDAASASLHFDESLLFTSLPANVTGEIIDQVFHLGGSDIVSAAATNLTTSASATPDDVMGQAIADLNQGAAVLDAAPTADLSARQRRSLPIRKTSIPSWSHRSRRWRRCKTGCPQPIKLFWPTPTSSLSPPLRTCSQPTRRLSPLTKPVNSAAAASTRRTWGCLTVPWDCSAPTSMWAVLNCLPYSPVVWTPHQPLISRRVWTPSRP